MGVRQTPYKMLVLTHTYIDTHTREHAANDATHTNTPTLRTRIDKHLSTCTCKHTNKTSHSQTANCAAHLFQTHSHLHLPSASKQRPKNVCCRVRQARNRRTKNNPEHRNANLGAPDPAIPLEEDECRDCTTLSGCKPHRRRIHHCWHRAMANQGGIRLLRPSRLRDGQ